MDKNLKLIIAGSRRINCYQCVETAFALSPFTLEEIAEVVSGGAAGIDYLGEQWAKAHGIPVKRFPADWGTHGNVAGYVRNRDMANYANAALIIWDGQSSGTRDMIRVADHAGLEVYVHEPNL